MMHFYDLRKECVKKYGEEFGKDYDTVCAGGSIGDFVDTVYFLGMVEEVRTECDAKYPVIRFTRWIKHLTVKTRLLILAFRARFIWRKGRWKDN